MTSILSSFSRFQLFFQLVPREKKVKVTVKIKLGKTKAAYRNCEVARRIKVQTNKKVRCGKIEKVGHLYQVFSGLVVVTYTNTLSHAYMGSNKTIEIKNKRMLAYVRVRVIFSSKAIVLSSARH